MKLRIKQRQGALAFKPESVTCVMTNAIDVLAFLVGRQALFGERPAQVFANLKMDKKPALLEYWTVSGLIIGTPANWKLSPGTFQKVMLNFGKAAPNLNFGSPKSKSSVSLYSLVAEYRRRLKSVDREGKGNIVAQLRMLCKRFDPTFVKEQLDAFFNNRSWPDYSVGQFEKFLKAQKSRT